MKLFLTSNGIFGALRDEDREVFFDLVGKPPSDIRVALIPTAGYPLIKQEYILAAINVFGGYGMAVEIVDLKEKDERTLGDKLATADAIYVNGGNTYWLLHWVRKSGFGKVIHQLLDQGKVYVGVSAGTIIACPDIREIGDSENVTGMEDTSGLGLVEFAISPHYSADDPRDLSSRSKTIAYPFVAIPDSQVILVNGDEVRIIGPGPRTTYNGFRETT